MVDMENDEITANELKKQENPSKKYPMIPTQVLMAREDCGYCPQSYKGDGEKPDNTQRCYNCGFGSEYMITGIINSAFEKILNPMLFIEKVNCEQIKEIDENKKKKGYHEVGDTIYRIINATSFSSKGIASSPCYDCRGLCKDCDSESTKEPNNGHICDLEDLCTMQDLFYANHVFNAIESNNKSIFTQYEVKDGSVKYDCFKYKCAMTELTEILIPVYINYNLEDLRQRGVVGLWLIGQFAVGERLSSDNLLETEWYENAKDDIETLINKKDKNIMLKKIEELKNRVWYEAKKENNGKKIYSSIVVALNNKANGSDKTEAEYIDEFKDLLRSEIKARETEFLHTYQSNLMKIFKENILIDPTSDKESDKEADDIKNRIINIFNKIRDDFRLKQLHLFIPELKMKIANNEKTVKGINIFCPESDSFTIDIDKPIIGNDSSNPILMCDDMRNALVGDITFTNEDKDNFEFYRVVSGNARSTILFGFIIEWEEMPIKHDGIKYEPHKDFFRAILDIYSSKIMAHIAGKRFQRLAMFTEITNHDLNHHLQSLEAQNSSFWNDYISFFQYRNIDEITFGRHLHNHHKFSNDLFDMLSFLKSEMESDNVYSEPDPSSFYVHNETFAALNRNYNSNWYKRNIGHRLLFSPSDRYSDKIWVDKAMFWRIIRNLLDNAYKYSHTNTNIYVWHSWNNNNKNPEIIFRVVNFGNKIPQSTANRMFDYGESGVHRNKGGGKGLYVAKEFAERNNGSLNIISGVIPERGEMSDDEYLKVKQKNGLISDTNFTIYGALKQWVRENPKHNSPKVAEEINNKIEEFEEKRESLKKAEKSKKVAEVAEGKMVELMEVFSMPNILHAVLVNPDDIKPKKDPDSPILNPLGMMALAKSELYMIMFELRLPMDLYGDKR